MAISSSLIRPAPPPLFLNLITTYYHCCGFSLYHLLLPLLLGRRVRMVGGENQSYSICLIRNRFQICTHNNLRRHQHLLLSTSSSASAIEQFPIRHENVQYHPLLLCINKHTQRFPRVAAAPIPSSCWPCVLLKRIGERETISGPFLNTPPRQNKELSASEARKCPRKPRNCRLFFCAFRCAYRFASVAHCLRYLEQKDRPPTTTGKYNVCTPLCICLKIDHRQRPPVSLVNIPDPVFSRRC